MSEDRRAARKARRAAQQAGWDAALGIDRPAPEDQDQSVLGLTFYDDGTAAGRGHDRAPVLAAQYLDGRQRKSALGRGLAGFATGGLTFLLGSANAGYVVVIVVTRDWTHSVRSKGDDGRATKLYALALQAKVRASL